MPFGHGWGEKGFKSTEAERRAGRKHQERHDGVGGKRHEIVKHIRSRYFASAGKFKKKYWREWELKFLKQTDRPARAVAFALGRSVLSVKQKRARLRQGGRDV